MDTLAEASSFQKSIQYAVASLCLGQYTLLAGIRIFVSAYQAEVCNLDGTYDQLLSWQHCHEAAVRLEHLDGTHHQVLSWQHCREPAVRLQHLDGTHHQVLSWQHYHEAAVRLQIMTQQVLDRIPL